MIYTAHTTINIENLNMKYPQSKSQYYLSVFSVEINKFLIENQPMGFNKDIAIEESLKYIKLTGYDLKGCFKTTLVKTEVILLSS